MLVAELNRSRRIGVEHEFYIALLGDGSRIGVQRMIANVLAANGIRSTVRMFSRQPLADNMDVAVETDSSVHGTTIYQGVAHFPIEVKTRILTGIDDWESVIPKVLPILAYLGGRLNQSCGYHVHLGMPEVKEKPSIIRSLYNLFLRFEPVIIGSLVSPSRRRNWYCRPMPDRSKLLHGCESIRSFQEKAGDLGRYYGLNLTHLFDDDPHVEIRYHQGTLDPEKARHWLRFCLQMVEHACTRSCQAMPQVGNNRNGMNRLLTSCGFRPNSQIYQRVSKEIRGTGRFLLLKRFRHFNRRERGARES